AGGSGRLTTPSPPPLAPLRTASRTPLSRSRGGHRTVGRLAPEMGAGNGSPFHQRPQLRPHDTLSHKVPASVGPKPTIRTGNHPAPIPHDVDGLAEAIGHHFGMFDI